MAKKEVYIWAAGQISVQSPLSEAWMTEPLCYREPYVQAIDPDYKQYFAPNTLRRLGKILRRALLTSRRVMEETGIACPDAIITATGLGCIENTEIFLDALIREGEELLKPTHFMQSTHNTIGSLIAIDSSCHGYNTTYAHKGISFECALSDAFLQLSNGRIATALTGAHDEMTPDYFVLLKRMGYLGHAPNGFSGETAVSLLLGGHKRENALCRLQGIEFLYRPEKDDLQQSLGRLLQQSQCRMEDIDAVMTGYNGQEANDRVYTENCARLFPGKRLLHYKHLFGESYTASGLGVYAAAACLGRQSIPAHLFFHPGNREQQGVRHLLFYNQFENKNHSFILLSACGK
ncbi:MAG: beta-ketoacyl synthase chain length factor [Dysgonamonadaceae bacterium]|jgi:3-oxoacyl-(acyl-carrier-protein) synthase|nr:beta-ketoacyl synthase chain length factor [Dysgonamonadaceae bacterium]